MRQARHAVQAGIDAVQIRESDLEGAALARIVSAVVDAARGSATRVIVNDRLDVALACRAHGVHLPAAGLPAAAVRTIVPQGFLIGRSVHSAGEAASAGPVDYLVAGTVLASAGKPVGRPLLGVDGLAAIVRAAAVPVLAIGGITPPRFPEIAQTGAAGVAGIGLFMGEAADSSGCRAVPLDEVVMSARRV